jgi:iron complex outermembrane receptor protein
MLLLCVPAGTVAAAELSSGALKALTLEQLMDVEVTSVSRKKESLVTAAAAITVVSNEDLRRSGATSIPEALRFVPGMHVARRNSNSWAVSSRGFSSVSSEKLLVLSDTRSIYTPLYSGVFWDVQDYLLQDVDRIEVIDGAGAALWGSNAVNGVINITTKRAQDTQGLYGEALLGSEERSAGVRFGDTTGDVSYRFFGKYFDRDNTFHPAATSDDNWHMGHVGFRADWDAATADAWTVQADAYQGTVGQYTPSITILGRPGPTENLQADVSGGNVLARWRRTFDATSDVQLRAYYDRTHRDDPSYRDELETIDLDFQHRFAPSPAQELIWGLSYRSTDNQNTGKGIFALQPRGSTDNLLSAFVQDQIALDKSLHLTLGTKLEYNDFSGFEYQPNIRLAWELSSRQVLWSAVSRAARVPTRIERDIAVDVLDPASNPRVQLLGNDDFESEELLSYEAGYRWQAADQVAFDLNTFYNRYEGLASLEFGTPFFAADGRLVLPVVNQNLSDGRSIGAGLSATLVPSQSWRLIATYSYIDITIDTGGDDLNRGRFIAGSTPRHQFGLRSLLDITDRVQLDAQWRHHTPIRHIPDIVSGEGINAYSELDVRGAWRATQAIEVSIVGQNLLHDHHPEFGTPEARGEIERSVYAKIAWGF